MARAHRGKFDSREMAFLLAYYGATSPTKGNAEQSGLAAGYPATVARTQMARVIKRFGDASMSASLNAVGVNKPYLAMVVRQILETGNNKEKLDATKLACMLMGESTSESGAMTINSTAPVMVVVGASKERIAALRSAAPQPTREELERLQNERVNEKLERLRAGETFVKRPHTKAQLEEGDVIEVAVPSEQGCPGELCIETTLGAGGLPLGEGPPRDGSPVAGPDPDKV